MGSILSKLKSFAENEVSCGKKVGSRVIIIRVLEKS